MLPQVPVRKWPTIGMRSMLTHSLCLPPILIRSKHHLSLILFQILGQMILYLQVIMLLSIHLFLHHICLPLSEKCLRSFHLAHFLLLCPFLDSYVTHLVASLELDTSLYSHVPCDILSQFKTLLCKYQHIFHLPGSTLSTVKGFTMIKSHT